MISPPEKQFEQTHAESGHVGAQMAKLVPAERSSGSVAEGQLYVDFSQRKPCG
jgi:hypothetical protein